MKRTILMLILCLLCLVSITYSWFSSISYTGSSAKYNKAIVLGGGVVKIDNYYGVMVNSDTSFIDYFLIDSDQGIEIDNLYPGARQFFKTVVYNETDKDLTLSVLLASVTFDPELTHYVSIVATNPYNIVTDTEGYVPYTDASENNHLYNRVYGVKIGDRVNIKPNSSISIVWHVSINEEAPNSCMGKKIKIHDIQTASS